MSEELLTVAEAAAKLSVSSRTIQRYCKQGLLNHKWVAGKRHKELRIIPPIPVSELPGVKKKKVLSKADVENIIEEQKLRIEKLEKEITQLKSLSHDTGLLKKADSLVNDFDKVRPIEKKLILKMAKEIKVYGDYLRSIGMNPTEHDDSSEE
jgi:hypothetical protein